MSFCTVLYIGLIQQCETYSRAAWTSLHVETADASLLTSDVTMATTVVTRQTKLDVVSMFKLL